MSGLGFAGGLNREQIAGHVPHCSFGVGFGFGPTRATQGVEERSRFPSPYVLADQVGFRNRHVKLWRRLIQPARRVFDDQAFLTVGWILVRAFREPGAAAKRKDLQSQVTADPMLQMDHIVSVLQVREIDVQRGSGGLRVR